MATHTEELGQSTCIGIGGDPISGTSQKDAVQLFNEDPDCRSINDQLVAMLKEACNTSKSTFLNRLQFIAGASAPKGRTMGLSAIISENGAGTAEAKFQR